MKWWNGIMKEGKGYTLNGMRCIALQDLQRIKVITFRQSVPLISIKLNIMKWWNGIMKEGKGYTLNGMRCIALQDLQRIKVITFRQSVPLISIKPIFLDVYHTFCYFSNNTFPEKFSLKIIFSSILRFSSFSILRPDLLWKSFLLYMMHTLKKATCWT